MNHPLYVLLPADVDWTPVAGTTAQAPRHIRWYLRQHMPEATQQVAVLVAGDASAQAMRAADVQRRAESLGGVVVDAETQQLLDVDALAARA